MDTLYSIGHRAHGDPYIIDQGARGLFYAQKTISTLYTINQGAHDLLYA
jgi:hypothetical protein